MFGVPCLCDNRTDVQCTEDACSIAGPGEPGNRNSCRACWLRLGRPSLEGPGLGRKLVNFGKAATRHLLTGAQNVPDEVAEQRLAICQTCDYFDAENTSCKHQKCGCRMKVKTAWQSAACPIGKWAEWAAYTQTEESDDEI